MTLRSAGIGCLATLLASAALAGCGSLGYEESLTYRSAQHQLAEAKRDPAVRQHGGVFLRDAEETLKKARAARFDRAQSDHLAYLALRKVEIAQSIAGLQVASADLRSLAEKSLARDAIPSHVADRALSADKQPPGSGGARPGASGPQKVAALPAGTAAGAAKPKSASGPAPKKPAATPVDGPMSAALESAAARKDPRSAVFAISGIDTADRPPRLSSDAERSLTPLVSYLRDNRDSRIIVEGYTSDKGSHEDDLSGSLGVAEAVKTYLTGQGIDGGRIFTLGRGADAVAGNAAPPSRQPGGRIEIGLFQGIAGPAPALTSRTGSPAPPEPFPLP